MKLFNFFVIFLILIPQISFSENISEEELGIENSASLKEEVQKKFLNSNGEISIDKLDDFKKLALKLRKEYEDNLISEYQADGLNLESSKEKASGDKILVACDFITNRIDFILGNELEPKKIENEFKKILRVYFSIKNISDDMLIIHGLKNFISLIFIKYDIPLDETKSNLSSNLPDIKNKRYFTQNELLEKIHNGEDLSLIDPPDGPYWKKPRPGVINPISGLELGGGVPKVFEFDEVILSESRPKINIREILPDGKKRKWKMKFGREVNTEFVASRIMNLLGFNSDTYYYIKFPRVYLKNIEEYNSMINAWVSHYEGDDTFLPEMYIKGTGTDERGFYVDFYEGLLEERPKEEIRLLGFHYSEMGNWERREVRAQLLVQAFINQTDNKEFINNKTKIVQTSNDPSEWKIQELIHDVGMSFGSQFVPNMPNEYSWSFLKRTNKKIKIAYKNNQFIRKDKNPYQTATYSDLKWIARYFAQIKKEQLVNIIKFSGWPEEVGKLFLEKMFKRRNEIVSSFDLEKEGFDLWEEVEPKDFIFGDSIVNGKLKKDYKSPTPVNYIKYNIVPFLVGDIFTSLVPLIINSTRSIPYYEMIPLPIEMPGVVFERFFPGLGFGVRLKREVTKNPNAISQDTNWITHDTLELFGTIGAKGYFPVVEPIHSRIRGSFLMGKQYSLAYYSSTPFKAAVGDFKKLVSLPFKKRKIIQSLRPGELYSDGIFIGMELEEQVLISGTVIGVGVETEQRKKFVTRTIVYKDNKEKMEVSKEKSDEFTLSIGGIVSLFEFLDIEFLSASVMLGKSTANTYYFDFSGPNKTKQDLAFNQLVYTHKKYPELDEIPHGTTTSKYYEKAFSLGLLATFGGKTRGEWIIKSDPEGGEKRTFNYDTQFTTSNLFSGNNNKFRVHGVLEFEGNDFNNPSKRSVTAHYEVKDDVSSYKELKHRLFKVNEMVGDKNFVTYTPELYTVNHQGPTYMNLNLTLRENAFECIFEKKNCAAKGPRAHKVDRELEKVRKKEGAVKEFIKFGNFLKESLVLEDKFSNLRKFIGEEKFDAEFWLKGEFVSDEGFVHVNRPAKIQ